MRFDSLYKGLLVNVARRIQQSVVFSAVSLFRCKTEMSGLYSRYKNSSTYNQPMRESQVKRLYRLQELDLFVA